MRRESAGYGRQQNRNAFRGRLLRRAVSVAVAVLLVTGSAGEALAAGGAGTVGAGEAPVAGESAGTSGASAETSQVPVIEYASLEELVKGSNPQVKAKRVDLDRWVGQYQAARDEIMENRASLRKEAKELKEDGDEEGYRHYTEQAKLLKESADELDRQIRSLNSASNTMELRLAEDTAALSAQDVMAAWHSLRLDRDSAAARLEFASYQVEQITRRVGLGMAAQADADQAARDQEEAKNRVDTLDAELAKLKRELLLLTGYTYDGEVEIGALPAADTDRAEAISPEADRQKAWGNSYELRQLRHSGFSGTNKEKHSRERSMAESEQSMYTKLISLDGQVKTAKTACLAARSAMAAAELDFKAAEHKWQLGMINRQDYLKAKVAYTDARAESGKAEISLLGALNRYDWAVRGLILE